MELILFLAREQFQQLRIQSIGKSRFPQHLFGQTMIFGAKLLP
ncbi:hypothetical protein GvMRE_I1g736 [endosymbiont GvMRE of Glomus versiforme]|nr:hypothetical protein GvMRE_I1g736 [endosymbiont GvMRE of Glomus versiforme]